MKRAKDAAKKKLGRQNHTSRALRPGDGRARFGTCTLAAEDATTNGSAKTQEPGGQEQEGRRSRCDTADACILNCSDWSNDSGDDGIRLCCRCENGNHQQAHYRNCLDDFHPFVPRLNPRPYALAFFRRRNMPPKATKPVPINSIEAGSGV
jgi:hypothetical protein